MSPDQTSDLIVSLPSERETRFTRVFRHRSDLLFAAWTQPEHIRHWWGCEGTEILACDVDLREGGGWRIVARMPGNGAEQVFSGTYKEIVPGCRLVYSECYEAPQFGSPTWQATIMFVAIEGGTRLTHTLLYASRDMRDMHLKFGMESGERLSLAKLDEHLSRPDGPTTQARSDAAE